MHSVFLSPSEFLEKLWATAGKSVPAVFACLTELKQQRARKRQIYPGRQSTQLPSARASESLDVDMQDFKQAFQTVSNHHFNIILIWLGAHHNVLIFHLEH